MPRPPDPADWLDAPFAFPPLNGRKVLVLGLGGGCDIITAYAFSRLFPDDRPRAVVYANTKKRDDGTLGMITPHIGRVPAGPAAPARGRTHGTTRIDQGVPRGDEGCPWIFLLPPGDAEERLPAEIRGLGFDLVFAVDTGGDSLAAEASSGDGGRDKRMLRVLRKTGLPVYHVVVAPGSDGEATHADLAAAFAAPENRARYRGAARLDSVLPEMRTLSEGLGPGRTPRIILAAADDRLKRDAAGRLVVPRGCRPAVPRDWLLRAFVFADGQGSPEGTP